MAGANRPRPEQLPAGCGVTYIYADAEKVEEWRARMPGEGLRVGFSWAGWKHHKNNLYRNAHAELFAPLLAIPGTSWFCLQRDEQDALDCLHVGDEFADMSDTAAAMTTLDLVVTIDCVHVHLVGALGVKCFALLTHNSKTDWRWILDRADTPWYASVTLYRQKTLNDWQEVFERVRTDIEALL